MREGRGVPGVPLTAVIGHRLYGECSYRTHTRTYMHTYIHLMASLWWRLKAKSAAHSHTPKTHTFQSSGCTQDVQDKLSHLHLGQSYRTIKERQAHRAQVQPPRPLPTSPTISKHSSSSPAADVSEPPFTLPSPYFFCSSGSVPIKHVETIGGVLALRLKGGEVE